jgi:hypothetical protein
MVFGRLSLRKAKYGKFTGKKQDVYPPKIPQDVNTN